MSKGGAKQRMGILQGRGADVCEACLEDVANLKTCGICSGKFCTECHMDHKDPKGGECGVETKETKGKK